MPESFVQVTEGSGKKLHTNQRAIGANTVEDEVVVLGESYLPTYSVNTLATMATAGDHLLALMAGASLNLRIRRIYIEQFALATTSDTVRINVSRLTSAGSGGTVVTPTRFNLGDPAAGATCRSLPSTKGTEIDALIRLSLGLASADPIGPTARYEWRSQQGAQPIIVPAGAANGLCLINVVAAASASVNVGIEFDESSF